MPGVHTFQAFKPRRGQESSVSGSPPCPSAHVVVIVTTGKLEEEMSKEVMTRRFGAESDCRIAARRRKGPAFGLALCAPER